jgi:hypothetical protein
MTAAQRDIDGSALEHHIQREQGRRLAAGTLTEPLPRRLRLADEQITDWSRRWVQATRGAPISFDEAQAAAARFLNPVLDDSVAGRQWNASHQRWE